MRADEYDKSDLICNFGDEFIEDNLDYFYEWLEGYEDFIRWDKDNEDYAKDPYKFLGVSENDFH